MEPALENGRQKSPLSNEEVHDKTTYAARRDDHPSSFSRIPVSDTRSTAEDAVPEAGQQPPPAPPPQPRPEEGLNGRTPALAHSSKSPEVGTVSKNKQKAVGVPKGPAVNTEAVVQANLQAAPIVGVVGFGPGNGGGSGIKRHTPSCDFCKRKSIVHCQRNIAAQLL